MISVSLFIIIVTIGMDALLNANLLGIQSQKTRSIMDNMSFVMEDMSRNLRTGINYDCIPYGTSTMNLPTSTIATSGQSCGGIAFNPASGGTMWTYYIGTNPVNPSISSLFKVVDGSTLQLTPDEVSISSVSGFSVLGAESPSATIPDYQQPFVIIRLAGKIQYQKITIPFSLETSVSQRQADL
jgi:hypothetical protein